MSRVIFLGQYALAEELGLTDLGIDELLYASDNRTVYEAVRTSSPQLVIVDSTNLSINVREFLQELVRLRADFHAPIFIVNTTQTPPQVGLCEWSKPEGNYRASNVSFERLTREVARIVTSAPAEAIEEAREIGFYDYIEEGGQFFHIQTEVITPEDPIVQTTVLKGGAIVDVISNKVPSDENIARCSAETAATQHQTALSRARAGKYN